MGKNDLKQFESLIKDYMNKTEKKQDDRNTVKTRIYQRVIHSTKNDRFSLLYLWCSICFTIVSFIFFIGTVLVPTHWFSNDITSVISRTEHTIASLDSTLDDLHELDGALVELLDEE